MGNMDGPMGNATPTTSWHQLHWWKSPRCTVARIEALTVVAIIISFFLAAFGSCRRWSNSWIVQKGFSAAQVLSLSLGTYSIGLMQSSSVRSEMYPVWTVSLFTLFGCIDPVTTYNGVDYKGPLSKVVFGICLNCGYVLLMSTSSITNVIGKAAIITLSAITFIKGFHRSFAIVQQKKIWDMVNALGDSSREILVFKKDMCLSNMVVDHDTKVLLRDIEVSIRNNNDERLQSCYDMWVALHLSHKLQSYFLGLDCRVPLPDTLKDIDFQRALKVIEIELAFVYDVFFTGNPFLHYYQAKTACLWALASFAGICFVLVATAIPGGMTGLLGDSACTKVVDTIPVDLAITFGILVSLALLQLLQLVRSWTSNWARADVARAYYARKRKEGHSTLSGWMRLRVFVATSTNLLDKYLWQDKMSQYSILPEPRLLAGRETKGEGFSSSKTNGGWMRRICVDLDHIFGLHYIWQVILELLSSGSNKRGGVKLDEDMKVSVIEFLGQIRSDLLDGKWLSSLPKQREIRHFLPHVGDPRLLKPEVNCHRYTSCVMTWHIVTWYCEVAEQTNYFQRSGGGETKTRDHRRVANALSQYCIYLVKFAPELLPGPVAWTKRVYDGFVDATNTLEVKSRDKDRLFGWMSDHVSCLDWCDMDLEHHSELENGQGLAKLLMRRPDEIWKTLALVWVQLLVYAAPYGNAEAHMRHLSQGGEFITHLWALLYHLDIRRWKVLGNVAEITSEKDAMGLFAKDDQAVVAYLNVEHATDLEELATASRLVDGTRYYYTCDPDIFDVFFRYFEVWSDREGQNELVFMKKEGNSHKRTFYDGEFRAYDIARFVIEKKIAAAQAQVTPPDSPTFGNPTIPSRRDIAEFRICYPPPLRPAAQGKKLCSTYATPNFAEPVAHVPTWSVAIADDSPTPPSPLAPATPIPTTTPPLDAPVPVLPPNWYGIAGMPEHEQRNPGQDEAAGALQLLVTGGAEPPVHGPSSPALLQQGVPVFSFGAGSEEHEKLAPKRRAQESPGQRTQATS